MTSLLQPLADALLVFADAAHVLARLLREASEEQSGPVSGPADEPLTESVIHNGPEPFDPEAAEIAFAGREPPICCGRRMFAAHFYGWHCCKCHRKEVIPW